jgi:hypothetical protein
MKTTNGNTVEKKVETTDMEIIIRKLVRIYPFKGNHYREETKFREFSSALDMLGNLTVLEFMRLFRNGDDDSMYDDIQKLNNNVTHFYRGKPAYEFDERLYNSGVMFVMYCYAYEPDLGLNARIGRIWQNFLNNLLDCGEYMTKLTGELNDVEIFRIRRFSNNWKCDKGGRISRIECCPTCGQTLS